jgi:hypothetical protein
VMSINKLTTVSMLLQLNRLGCFEAFCTLHGLWAVLTHTPLAYAPVHVTPHNYLCCTYLWQTHDAAKQCVELGLFMGLLGHGYAPRCATVVSCALLMLVGGGKGCQSPEGRSQHIPRR